MNQPARNPRRRDTPAFALVTTLIIVAVLAVVAVGFLSSMIGERQTADAYTSKTRAEQAAQAGVENSIAMLEQAFRDYPDSATAWDTQQSQNSDGSLNEGTTLYLHAAPSPGPSPSPSPAPTPPLFVPDPSKGSLPADDRTGNGPNNLGRMTFALPLTSGIPYGGVAQPVSQKASILPVCDVSKPLDPNLQTDPTKQYCAELNVRRYAGDMQGIIGSPPAAPNASATPSASPTPKPARAPWVNFKGRDGRITGRYAFWMEDESFRANNSFLGASPTPPDNTARAMDNNTPAKPRVPLPNDLTLVGPLTAGAGPTPVFDPVVTAKGIVNTRTDYVGGFFPDPLAFAHSDTNSDGTSALSSTVQDTLRYLMTNQSGTLNLTRHGTQRLNLNNTVTTVDLTRDVAPYSTSTTAIQKQINQLVSTLKFHLPYLGERFYRTSLPGTSTTLLNDATQVPGSPVSYTVGSDHSNIYYYKVAANLRDHIDSDSQPTMIDPGGNLHPIGAPSGPLDEIDGQANTFWAHGKESVPTIQEVAVRYRPVVTTTANATPSNPKGHFQLTIDYYIEFWNMTDRDISAGSASGAPGLNGATLWVRDQQKWTAYPGGDLLLPDLAHPGPGPDDLSNDGALADWQIDLTGVVFRAGAVTVITTDPDYAGWKYMPLAGPSNPTMANLSNVFLCPLVAGHGQRLYVGKIRSTSGTVVSNGGLMFSNSDFSTPVYSGTEISLINPYGYLDVVRGAITKNGGDGHNIYTNTYQGTYADFDYGGGLMGNVTDAYGGTAMTNVTQSATPSQMGDPRTNNEQLFINTNGLNNADGSHFMSGSRSIGSMYGGSAQSTPISTGTLQPDTFVAGQGWPDYLALQPRVGFGPYPSTTAATSPAVIADGPLTSVGQLGDVFDPARIPGAGGILYSRGGGRTFKIGQHDDRYSSDPSGNPSAYNQSQQVIDNIPASTAWASWRLADVFDVTDSIELPARININGVLRDQGAALLSALQGFQFQPTTSTSSTPSSVDPVVHGSTNIAGQSLDTTSSGSSGLTQLIAQIKTRFLNGNPSNGPAGPFFERGELGELGLPGTIIASAAPIFGMNPISSTTPANNLLVAGVDMNKTLDHSREELFRRIAQLICTRGDTFTVYAVGQSIVQATASATMKVTGTHRIRVTFRLVPKQANGQDFHPSYNVVSGAAVPISYDLTNATDRNNRFAKPDHYDAQILQTNTF